VIDSILAAAERVERQFRPGCFFFLRASNGIKLHPANTKRLDRMIVNSELRNLKSKLNKSAVHHLDKIEHFETCQQTGGCLTGMLVIGRGPLRQPAGMSRSGL
jgi:hypothetical protein